MKVFISSVRRGLEEERDALPSLIDALGHEPIRFEDFSAMAVPSRQACLAGVAAADVYILLLGPNYGDPLPDTGVSPTEEEFTAARRRGLPMLVFRKSGGSPEPAQSEFIIRVEDYSSGRFRASYSSTPELFAAVAQSLRDIATEPKALEWSRLESDAARPNWIIPDRGSSGVLATGTTLELHALPTDSSSWLRVQDLESLGPRLAQLGRARGFFSPTDALAIHADDREVIVQVRPPATPSRGIRTLRDRATACWTGLPRDMLGTILDRADLESRLDELVRQVADTRVLRGAVTFGVSVAPISLVSEGSIDDLNRRSGASFAMAAANAARVLPEDAVAFDALDRGAPEVAIELTSRLLHAFRRATGR